MEKVKTNISNNNIWYQNPPINDGNIIEHEIIAKKNSFMFYYKCSVFRK